jgi:hypothetical protein
MVYIFQSVYGTHPLVNTDFIYIVQGIYLKDLILYVIIFPPLERPTAEEIIPAVTKETWEI